MPNSSHRPHLVTFKHRCNMIAKPHTSISIVQQEAVQNLLVSFVSRCPFHNQPVLTEHPHDAKFCHRVAIHAESYVGFETSVSKGERSSFLGWQLHPSLELRRLPSSPCLFTATILVKHIQTAHSVVEAPRVAGQLDEAPLPHAHSTITRAAPRPEGENALRQAAKLAVAAAPSAPKPARRREHAPV
jgi:hypothetical protein